MSSNLDNVTFGEPIDMLPGRPGQRAAKRWSRIADYVRAIPNKWVPVTIEGASRSYATSIAGSINMGRLYALDKRYFQGAVRKGQLYVRFTPEGVDDL